MPTTLDLAASLGGVLDTRATEISRLNSYFAGTQAAAYLSPAARAALGDRFRTLSVNFPRLVVTSIAERLEVTGFRLNDPDSPADADLWRIWKRNGLLEGSSQAHIEALTLGSAYVIVWAGRDKRTPLVTVESAAQVAVQRDPATREITAAIKRWVADGVGYATVFEADKITRLRSQGHVVADAFPAHAWETQEVIPNPLGVVPVVALVNRGRLLDLDGVSEMEPILDIADAVNKITSDMLVTSEFYARPRRWVTGLEIIEDEDGNVVNPFASEASRVWQSEDPATKFGQFDQARLDGYADALATLTQQIGALSGLPPHYLGLHGDQPASADAIRSAEASLVATARACQRTFGAAWADVQRLVIAVRDGVDPDSIAVESVWADSETRTPAQAADAAAKLVAMGLPLVTVLETTLGYSPAQIARIREQARSSALDNAGVDIASLMP